MLDYLKRLLMDQLPSFVNYMVVKNVMFTKLLQSMAGIDNMPHEIDEIIKKNTNHVNYTDDEIDFKMLVKVISDYKITLDSLTPINSGMVAIVFSGVNADKKRIVLKIRRKNIRTRIENGYIQFTRIYNFVRFITYPFGYLDEILANLESFIETKDYILTQCNFDKEIEAIVKTKTSIEEYTNDDIMIPFVYNSEQDRVNTEFILMDRIEGTTCYGMDERYKEHICELLFNFTFITSYFSDICHVDLHPGNIFCIPDGDKCKIGIIDFGMHIENTDKIREFSHGILDGFIKVANGNTEVDILKHCTNTVVPPIDVKQISPEQYKDLNNVFIRFVDTIGTGKLDETAIHEVNIGIRKVLKTNVIVLCDYAMKYAMGLSMLQSSARLLVNDKKKLSIIIKKALREVMSY